MSKGIFTHKKTKRLKSILDALHTIFKISTKFLMNSVATVGENPRNESEYVKKRQYHASFIVGAVRLVAAIFSTFGQPFESASKLEKGRLLLLRSFIVIENAN